MGKGKAYIKVPFQAILKKENFNSPGGEEQQTGSQSLLYVRQEQ